MHTSVTGLQIGHGWLKNRQTLPGQYPSVTQPLPALAPAAQTPVSQVPLVQSVSCVQGAPSLVQRPKSLAQTPPPAHALPTGEQTAPGVDPPLQRAGRRSPVTKTSAVSAARVLSAPVSQSALPLGDAFTVSRTQALATAEPCRLFDSGTGGPKRHPGVVQRSSLHAPPGQSPSLVHPMPWLLPPTQRLPPASAGVVAVSVRLVPVHDETFRTDVTWSGICAGGKPAPAPPKYSRPQVSWKKLGFPGASS